MASHPKSPFPRSPLSKISLRGVLSPPGSPSHPSPLTPGPHRRSHAQPHFATSVPAGHLPSYGHTDSVPNSPPAPPHPCRRPSGPYQSAMTMPSQPLPDSFGSPAAEALPAYSSHVVSQSYHGHHLSSSIASRHRDSVSSPSGTLSPRSTRVRSLSRPRSASVPRPLPVNSDSHKEAVRRHHLADCFSRFFFSSFEYLLHSYYLIHPAFTEWVHKLGPEALAVIWRELPGNILLPVVLMYEYKSKANVQNYDVGARLEYLLLSADGKSFSTEYMGDICIREEWHLVHKNKPLLMFAQPLNPKLIPVRGQMFAPKGTDKRYPTKAKTNVQLLTVGFREDKSEKCRWEITRDRVIEIAEKTGDGDRIGIVSPNSSVHGYIVDGPIVWEEGTKHPELWKNGFLTHIIMGLIVFPLERPANMTRLLRWLAKLGPLAVEEWKISRQNQNPRAGAKVFKRVAAFAH